MSNAWEGLQEIYDIAVKEADSAGNAENFKEATELFFIGLKAYFKTYNLGEITETVQYLDGYYIFGMGTNSVVHYWLDRCPDWKFGIWWDKTQDGDIVGDFFAQYEPEIDKFKPTRSELCVTHTINLEKFNKQKDSNEITWIFDFEIYDMIKFIMNEPELAFCRFYCGWNYNLEYHSKEDAVKKFLSVKQRRENEENLQNEYNSAMIDFFKDKIFPLFKGAKIVDKGDSYFPRFDFCVPVEQNTDIFEETGLYDLFDKEFPDNMDLKPIFDKINEDYQKRADELNVFISNPIHDTILVCSEDALKGEKN